MKKVIIIGAGASGVYLSILLKKCHNNYDVTIIEQNSSPLKKLLATGNGRCNLSNDDMDISYYQSDNQELVQSLIDDFNMEKEMDHLGIMTKYQNHLLYPFSEQAVTIKNVFIETAKRLGVHFIYNEEVLEIKKNYTVYTSNNQYHCDIVVFAMGSEAGKLSGVNQSRYNILKKLQLEVVKPTPSLVQMNTIPAISSLKGVRVKGTFTLIEDNKNKYTQKGELLFTEYGISGIAVMQLSSYIKENHSYDIMIDFYDDFTYHEFTQFIQKRLDQHHLNLYEGIMNTKLAHYFHNLNLKTKKEIVSSLKGFKLHIKDLRSSEHAQVMKGGLSLKEVSSSLEIKKYPYMYAMGEILNVAGMCGGYNLHFAFSCAKRVAQSIEGK